MDTNCAPDAANLHPRSVYGFGESLCNSQISIAADERDESGGSHEYLLFHPAGCNVLLFQKGPIRENGVNGISDEALLAVVRDRLEGFQAGPYKSRENALAITKIEEALHWLNHRTGERRRRGVEGTSNV